VYDAQSSSKTVNGKFTVKLARLANAIAKQSAGLTRRLPAAAEAADGTAKTEWMIDYGSTSDAADNDVLDAVFAGY
jgi:hypothetical protein